MQLSIEKIMEVLDGKYRDFMALNLIFNEKNSKISLGKHLSTLTVYRWIDFENSPKGGVTGRIILNKKGKIRLEKFKALNNVFLKYKSCLLCLEEGQHPFAHKMSDYSNFVQIDDNRLHLSCFIREISRCLLGTVFSIMLDPKSDLYSDYIQKIKDLSKE